MPGDDPQLHLFDLGPPPAEPGVGPAPLEDATRELATRLPPQVRLGTSSWSFPGWRGLVYDRSAAPRTLARQGLAAYARHPLLRAVGIDRTYYAPATAAELAAHAADVPDDFRFLVKAHDALLTPTIRGRGANAGKPNPQFLDAEVAGAVAVDPFVRGLGSRGGWLLFQFSPLFMGDVGGERALLDRLHGFLRGLPPGPPYAVEIRNRSLLTAEYAALLADTGVAHCYNVHPDMPPIGAQRAVLPPGRSRHGACVRWMLHRTLSYGPAQERYAPFDRLVDEDPESRAAIAALVREVAGLGLPIVVIANNKAEGSAPLTIRRLAESSWRATERPGRGAGVIPGISESSMADRRSSRNA